MTNVIDQPARKDNIAAIVEFYKRGVKKKASQLGIELEHTIVTVDNNPVGYTGEHGVKWLLEQLSADFPESTTDIYGDLLGVARPGEAVTIEPAAQLELSAGPFASLDEASRTFEDFERTLANLLTPVGEKALTIGYHPTALANHLELIPKRRYELMDLYLGRVDSLGVNMMRGSASTQVSIDYTSVTDCLRKLRIAFALVPIFSLICDNSPFFEGKPRTHELMRTEIWDHTDPARCGIVPGVMDPGFTLEQYAEYILDTPAILTSCEREQWCYTTRTFGEIYATTPMTEADVLHALSMFFTDVRLKSYIEIRPADALPIPYAISYAALIKGLFYDEQSLNDLDHLTAGISAEDIRAAKDTLMDRGYDAVVYGQPVSAWADELVNLARRGLSDEEASYLDPLARLIKDHVTLATEGSIHE